MAVGRRKNGTEGIESRHGRKDGADCPAKANPASRCKRYRGCKHRGFVYNAGTLERGPWTADISDAKSWRINRRNLIHAGEAPKATTVTLKAAWDAWKTLAEEGVLAGRGGEPYKPSTIRTYERSLALYVFPQYENLPLSKFDRPGLQRLVDQMGKEKSKRAARRSASAIRNTITALRVVFRDSERLGCAIYPNPCERLRLPAQRKTDKRKTTPGEIRELLGMLPESERPLWTVFFYAGLRLGEAQALRWENVDIDAGLIRVRYSWDVKAGPILPMSGAGRRDVPMTSAVRVAVAPLKGDPAALVFGRSADRPFQPKTVANRAKAAWGSRYMSPHPARHAYAALMLAAGTPMEALKVYMGHSSITVTIDLYGYLLEGTEAIDAGRLDALLAAAA
jgi:integrase